MIMRRNPTKKKVDSEDLTCLSSFLIATVHCAPEIPDQQHSICSPIIATRSDSLKSYSTPVSSVISPLASAKFIAYNHK